MSCSSQSMTYILREYVSSTPSIHIHTPRMYVILVSQMCVDYTYIYIYILYILYIHIYNTYIHVYIYDIYDVYMYVCMYVCMYVSQRSRLLWRFSGKMWRETGRRVRVRSFYYTHTYVYTYVYVRGHFTTRICMYHFTTRIYAYTHVYEATCVP